MDHKYPHGGVDYIFDQSNDQVLENIYSIFKCLENELNIHPEFIYYNNNKDYNNMLIILYNFKDTPFFCLYAIACLNFNFAVFCAAVIIFSFLILKIVQVQFLNKAINC